MDLRTSSPVQSPAPHRRILIADPSDGRLELCNFLADCGHRVQHLGSEADPIELAREFRPSVVFLDLLSPELDAWQVCQDLRREAAVTQAAIIGLMDTHTVGFAQRCRSTPFDAYLVRPVDLELVERLVDSSPDVTTPGPFC